MRIRSLWSHWVRRLVGALGVVVLVAGTMSVAPAAAATGDITTIAGGRGEGPATNLSVSPDGMAVRGSSLYIADGFHHVVRLVDTTTGQSTVVAGTAYRTASGNGGFTGDGGPAVDASLGSPSDVALDAAGNLFIADTANHRVRRVDAASGIITTVAGSGPTGGVSGFGGDGGPATAARLSRPFALTLDAGGNLFIADIGNYRVRKVDPAGTITTVAGTGVPGNAGDGGPATSATMTPAGVAVDASGNLFIAAGNNRVRKVDPAGTITAYAGSGLTGSDGDGGPATAAKLFGPQGLSLDAIGNLFIADRSNHRVRMVEATTGTITTVAGAGTAGFSGDEGPATTAQLQRPRSVAVGEGGVFVADGGNVRVRKVDRAGTITTVAGNGLFFSGGNGGPATSAQISGTTDVVFEDGGRMLISAANQVRRVDPAGTISAVAGNGEDPFLGDIGDGGPATEARVSPGGIALDGAGNLYMTDGDDRRVRKVDPAGTITTFAGTGACCYDGDGGPAGAAQLVAPRDVAADGAGNVFIADGNRVRKVDPAGTITTYAGAVGRGGASGDGGPATAAGFSSLDGLALDEAGNLFLAVGFDHRVRRIDARSGIITTVAGTGEQGFSGDGGPASAAQLDYPRGVTADGVGGVFIAEANPRFSTGNRVRRVDPAGTITTVAGTGGSGFSGDGGPASAAQLNGPQGLAVDDAGNLLIADRFNGRVRHVDGAVSPAQTEAKAVNDYDGDASTDIAVYRPANGVWYVHNSSGTDTALAYGTEAGDVPVPGDYDGDASTDIAVYRPANGVWYVHQSSGTDTALAYGGLEGDIPVPGDYDGDASTDIAIYRPANGVWYVHQSSGTDTALAYGGLEGDVPVPGDYDGDGSTDIAVYRPSNGVWYVHQSSGGDTALSYGGVEGDIPVPGDYDGDATTDIAIYRPSNGVWYVHNSSGGDTALAYGGLDGDVPVPGDYDGDGSTDIAIYRPSNGVWYVHQSSGTDTALAYGGIQGDVPLSLPHAIRNRFLS